MAVTIDAAKQFLELAYLKRDEIVPCFLGIPGIGKTEVFNQFAREKGVKVVSFILSQTLPTEISGINMPCQDTKTMEVFDSARLGELEDGDILLLDELFEAPPQVMSACLTMIQDRVLMSGKKLPDIMIAACANETISPNMLSLAFKERFFFVKIEPSVTEWAWHIITKYGVVPTACLVDHTRRYIAKSGSMDGEYNYPSPRTISKLLETYMIAESQGIEGFGLFCREVFEHSDFSGAEIYDDVRNTCRLKIDVTSDLMTLATRIYWMGAGEGEIEKGIVSKAEASDFMLRILREGVPEEEDLTPDTAIKVKEWVWNNMPQFSIEMRENVLNALMQDLTVTFNEESYEKYKEKLEAEDAQTESGQPEAAADICSEG